MTWFKRAWPLVIPIYDARQCPDCCALVAGKAAQRAHEAWHAQLADQLEEEPAEVTDPGGYIVGETRTEETTDFYAGER